MNILVVVVVRKAFCQPTCGGVSGQESSKRVWKNDGVLMLVSSHDTHNQTPHTDITYKTELEKENSRI